MRTAMRLALLATLAIAATGLARADDETWEREAVGGTTLADAQRVSAAPASGSVTDYLTFDAEPAVTSLDGRSAVVTAAVVSGAPARAVTAMSTRDAKWLRSRDGYRDGGY